MDKKMNDKSLDIIKRTKFFTDKIKNISSIEDISSNKIRVISNEKSYVLGLYSMDDFDKLKKKKLLIII
ncbi:hypothetical protein [Anaerococcus obesiensis]|uniref:hypothetical protein n=1 Tax=Anaerococcus obesiensis TaxID=1287640 RepID=UPI0003002935|nr:hypothetical protein [Anaerococcus obesiensis]